MQTKAILFIMNEDETISIMLNGTMRTIDFNHEDYEAIKKILKNQDWDKIKNQSIPDSLISSKEENSYKEKNIKVTNCDPDQEVDQYYREIGEKVEIMLDFNMINENKLYDILIDNGLDRVTAFDIQYLAHKGKHHKVKRKIIKLMKKKILKPDEFLKMLEEQDKMSCKRCGEKLYGCSKCPRCEFLE